MPLLSSASTDETIQLHEYPPPPHIGLKPMTPITHTTAFRAVLPIYLHSELDPDAFPYLLAGSGDCIRVYDISSLDEVELIREVEGHWHDVTHLRTWIQESAGDARRDVWVVSGSLDGTLRKWKLSGTVYRHCCDLFFTEFSRACRPSTESKTYHYGGYESTRGATRLNRRGGERAR